MSAHDQNTAVLVEMAEVKGQLSVMMRMMQNNHDTTQQRIDDFRHAIESRVSGIENRLATLEKNERGTALKGASTGAIGGAIATAAIEAMKFLANR